MTEIRKAIILIDTQNEFISKDGKLFNNVAEVFEDTKMLEKLPPFIKQARDASAIIIHSPLSINPNNPDHTNMKLPGLFEEGSWNAEFADGFQPAKRDYIMRPRKKFCCFGGSKLLTLLQKERIDMLFIGGFLADGSILETVKAANNLGMHARGLEIFVLRDGCSSSSKKRHEEMMRHILPLYCDIVTIKEASLMIDQGLSKVLRTSEGMQPDMFDPVKLLRQDMIDRWFPVERLVGLLGSLDIVTNAEFEDILVELNLASNVSPEKIFCVLDKEGKGEISTTVLLESLRPRADDVLLTKNGNSTYSSKPSLLIGLVAHNQMKVSMMKFLQDHISCFRGVKFVTNKSIARVLEESMGLIVEHQVSNVGCEGEISALLAQGKVCAVFSMTEQTETLNRLCCLHNVLFASNPITAHAVVSLLENSSSGYSILTGNNQAYHTSLADHDTLLEARPASANKLKKKLSKKLKKEKKSPLQSNVSERLMNLSEGLDTSKNSFEENKLEAVKEEIPVQAEPVSEPEMAGVLDQLLDKDHPIEEETEASTEECSIQNVTNKEPPIQDEPVHALEQPDDDEQDSRPNGLLQALSFRKTNDQGSQESDTIDIPDAITEAALLSPRIQGRKERIQKYIDDGKPKIANKMINSTLAEIKGLGPSTPVRVNTSG
mmetsp:Transcript_19404/g.29548  ORF Transcript_19404/g.29548 Transcript_19404/m.29548 type:complete len:661 (-) Transcript_19404:7-1989(-)